MKTLLLAMCLLVVSNQSSAQTLTIHAAEMGIGKFHRYDNTKHPYNSENVWNSFILANNAGTATPVIVADAIDTYTVYFSSLQELLQTSIKLSKQTGMKVGILNINAHGLPGGMWFPKSAAQRDSYECRSWREAASAPDKENYDQYYSAISKDEIMQMRSISQYHGHFACVVGLPEWKEIVSTLPEIQSIFSADAQVHFLSCIVGLGSMGDAYAKGIAKLLFQSPVARLQSSLMYGLGDWSMPEGMGFWDYQNDEQLDRDNSRYVVNQTDRDQMQKGSIRIASITTDGKISSSVLNSVDFMLLTHDNRDGDQSTLLVSTDSDLFQTESVFTPFIEALDFRLFGGPEKRTVHIPGTRFYTEEK